MNDSKALFSLETKFPRAKPATKSKYLIIKFPFRGKRGASVLQMRINKKQVQLLIFCPQCFVLNCVVRIFLL